MTHSNRDQLLEELTLSLHAANRLEERRIPEEAVTAVVEYGRVAHVRGAVIYAVGRREVDRAASHGVDLAIYEGLQVVALTSGTVLTVYRNHDFRGLRSDGKERRFRRRQRQRRGRR